MENFLTSFDEKDVSSSTISSCAILCEWILKRTGPVKVIEIGTSYGRQLSIFAPLSSVSVCVDPMYNWVPDLVDDVDQNLVDQKKIDSWNNESKEFKDKVKLVIANSFFVTKNSDHDEDFKDCSILIVDGCHHPENAVYQDYINFKKYMTKQHYIIWDDVNEVDVRRAVDRTKNEMKSNSVDFVSVIHGNAEIVYVNEV